MPYASLLKQIKVNKLRAEEAAALAAKKKEQAATTSVNQVSITTL